MLDQQLAELAALGAGQPRGGADVAAGALHQLHQVIVLELVDRTGLGHAEAELRFVRPPPRLRAWPDEGRIGGGQRGQADDRVVAAHVGPQRDVVQLAHVARPGMCLQRGHRRLAPVLERAMQANRHRVQEMLRQQGHVTLALAQRRQMQVQRVEPVLQILPEAAGFHLPRQAAVGGGDDARIRRAHGAAADRAVFAVLQEAQQGHLALGRERVDLIQEQGAAAGVVDQAGLGHLGIGEGAAAVAEQFALDQAVGNGAAIDRHEGKIPARAGVVDFACGDFLAGAGFALDQHLHVAGGKALQLRPHRDDCLGLADHDRHHQLPK